MTGRRDHKGRAVPQDAPSTRETPEARGARMGREAAGSYREAMRQQQAARDAAELAALVAEQRREMRRDGEQPANDLASSDPNALVLPPRHPIAEPESVYVGVAERVEWTSEARDIRASVEWQPSLVRLGQRQRVKHALDIDPSTLLDDIESLRAEMVGKTGKGKVLRKVKLARMLAALERLTAEPEPEPDAWLPAERPAAPVITRTIRQSDYVGFTGADRDYRPSASTLEVSTIDRAWLVRRAERHPIAKG